MGCVQPAEIQISLRNLRIVKDATFFYANNEDSHQTARMRSLTWVFVGRTCQNGRFLTSRLFMHSLMMTGQDAPCWPCCERIHNIQLNLNQSRQSLRSSRVLCLKILTRGQKSHWCKCVHAQTYPRRCTPIYMHDRFSYEMTRFALLLSKEV